MADNKVSVFVSYAHAGEGRRFLELCKEVVQVQVADPDIELWSDEKIEAGDDWQEKLESALGNASAAILLIDWKFILSKYIVWKEMPSLLPAVVGMQQAASGGESFVTSIPVIPILVEQCDYDAEGYWPALNRLQIEPEHSMRARVDPGRKRFPDKVTLDELTKPEIARFKTALAKRLRSSLQQRIPQGGEEGKGESGGGRLRGVEGGKGTPTPPDDGVVEGNGQAGAFTRYLLRGDDLCRDYVDLHISLAHAEFNTYRVEARMGVKDGNNSSSTSWQGLVRLSVHGDEKSEDPLDRFVRTELSKMPFDEEPEAEIISLIIDRARENAKRMGLPLQLRVGINTNAGELHEIPWERLPLETSGSSGNDEWILFSRCVLSAGDQAVEVQTPARQRTRVLLAYSDVGVEAAGGADPNLQAPALEEMKAAIMHMDGEVSVHSLSRPSPDNLLEHLSVSAPHDVLYLACEARCEEGEYYLSLGNGDLSRCQIEQHFLRAPVPRMVILVRPHQVASGPDDKECNAALAHIAAQFARLGVAAVVTSQHPMQPGVWNGFLARFFKALTDHGHVSGAIADARRELGGEWWHPVLLSRVKATRMWYRPGFVSDESPEDNWLSLISSLQNGRFCPVIGPGVDYRLQQSRIELAREMADEYDFPLSFSNRINLPVVAQYVRTLEARRPLFVSKLEAKIRSRLCKLIDTTDNPGESLNTLAARVGEVVLKSESDNPYNVLARLPIGLYLTTTIDPFIESALNLAKETGERSGGAPITDVDVFDFSLVDPDTSDSAGHGTLPVSDFDPTHPVLLQLYGSYNYLDRAAIAEDDYFQFLATFDRRMQDEKGALRGRLCSSDLVFLGFKWNSLDFRVLFRALQKYANPKSHESYHIAVQIDPDDDDTIHPDKVLEYLRRYFDGGRYLQQAHFSIFWGSAADFLRTLEEHMPKNPSRGAQ